MVSEKKIFKDFTNFDLFLAPVTYLFDGPEQFYIFFQEVHQRIIHVKFGKILTSSFREKAG